MIKEKCLNKTVRQCSLTLGGASSDPPESQDTVTCLLISIRSLSSCCSFSSSSMVLQTSYTKDSFQQVVYFFILIGRQWYRKHPGKLSSLKTARRRLLWFPYFKHIKVSGYEEEIRPCRFIKLQQSTGKSTPRCLCHISGNKTFFLTWAVFWARWISVACWGHTTNTWSSNCRGWAGTVEA